jgi:hypothetical protein
MPSTIPNTPLPYLPSPGHIFVFVWQHTHYFRVSWTRANGCYTNNLVGYHLYSHLPFHDVDMISSSSLHYHYIAVYGSGIYRAAFFAHYHRL